MTTENLHTTVALLYEALGPAKPTNSHAKREFESRLEKIAKNWQDSNDLSLSEYRKKTYIQLDAAIADYLTGNDAMLKNLNKLKEATSSLETLVEEDGRFAWTYCLLLGAFVALVMVFVALGRIPFPKSII
jgi:hypothetical protein